MPRISSVVTQQTQVSKLHLGHRSSVILYSTMNKMLVHLAWWLRGSVLSISVYVFLTSHGRLHINFSLFKNPHLNTSIKAVTNFSNF